MATETKPYELAFRDQGGSWELCGDYDSEADAVESARTMCDALFPTGYDSCVFGISGDRASGHYETRLEVFRDGTFTIRHD